jgi:eukaryotic-like serine/threonine-protein kinase
MTQTTIAGRYELLRPLAEGGMATLWLAKLTGSAGFAKLVVVKRILPALARAERFSHMFLDEGRLAADLRHPNIAQVLEVGADDSELFIAMELLEGLDAGQLMSRTLARGERLPLSAAVQIVLDAAAGLAYAHQKRTLDGESLDIVHRDISPQNLFVTVDGHTKVVDFGIAKARSQTTMTEVGVLKGKCAYMAPEQVCGDPVDHRSDQFALGVVLWELLAGERLFRRGNDIETLRAVLRLEIPRLRDVVDGVPPALEHIVERTLEADRDKRFSGCEQLVEALDDFLDAPEQPMRRGPRAVARVVRRSLAEPPAHMDASVERTLPQRLRIGFTGLSNEETSDQTPPLLLRDEAFVDEEDAASAPSPAPALIARESERAAVLAALEAAASESDAGPVTLVGPTGVGKSHLARAVLDALSTSGRAPGGTYRVDLAGAETGADVVALLGFALGIARGALPEDLERAGSLVGRALAARGRAFVFLDGVDGLRAAAAPLARLLAPHAGVLAAGLAPLEVMGERIVDVRPLAVPASGAALAQILEAPAVRLLLSAAELDSAAVSPEDAESLAAVARGTAGLPVALLLAGRWLGEQGAASAAREVVRRTQGGLFENIGPALTGRLDHLSDEDRALVLRLAPHRGPLEELLVESLSGAPAGSPQAREVLTRLGASGAAISGALAPAVREQALEELRARGELTHARARHAAALALVAEREVLVLDEASGDDAARALALLEALRPALEDALEALLSERELDDEDDRRVLWLALALDVVVSRRGASPAHLRLLDEALAHASPRMDPRLRARALEARADHEKVAGRTNEARADYVTALGLTRGDSALAALLHRNIADLELDAGDLVAAESHAREAVAAARRAHKPRLLARATWTLSRLAQRRGNVAEAEILLERALAAFETAGDRRFAARSLVELGLCAETRGDAVGARSLYERALRELDAEGDLVFAARARVHLGVVCAWLGDGHEALRHLLRAREDARGRGDVRAERAALSQIAELEAARGHEEIAAQCRDEARQLQLYVRS